MKFERGQALVEAVVALPVCVACALTLVDCSVLVRDRIAISQAAARAAEASMSGGDLDQAAAAAVPASLRADLDVSIEQDTVVVRGTSRPRIAGIVGRTFVHRSRVELAGVAR